MSIDPAAARCPAALLVVLALGCVPTGDDLFRRQVATVPAPAPVIAMSPPVTSEPSPTLEPVASNPQASEQLLVGGRAEEPTPPAPSETDIEPPDAAAAPASPPVPVPVPPTGPVSADPCGLPGAILCDTFEDDANATFPSGDGWLPELPGCSSHVVDGAGPSFSGKKALRADSGGYPECMLHADLSGESDVYVRTRVFVDGASDVLSEYVSLLELGPFAAQDEPELRIGSRPALDSLCIGSPGVDVSVSGLVGGPATKCTAFTLAPARWYCVEAHLVRAGAALNLSLSIDGAELVSQSFAGNPAWEGEGLFLKLGRASYGPSSPGSVWHDDVAVGRQPIPCTP